MADFHCHVSDAIALAVKGMSVPAVAAGACARQYRGMPRRQSAKFPEQKSGQSSRRVRMAGMEK